MTEMTGNLILKDFLCHRKAHRYNKKRIVSYITEPFLVIWGAPPRALCRGKAPGGGTANTNSAEVAIKSQHKD